MKYLLHVCLKHSSTGTRENACATSQKTPVARLRSYAATSSDVEFPNKRRNCLNMFLIKCLYLGDCLSCQICQIWEYCPIHFVKISFYTDLYKLWYSCRITTGHLSNGFLGLFCDAATARASPCKRCLDAKSVSAQTAKVAYVKTPKRQTWRGGYMGGSVYLILSLFVDLFLSRIEILGHWNDGMCVFTAVRWLYTQRSLNR